VVVDVILPAVLCLVLIGEAGIVASCHEFEWLGDKAAKFLGVWHLNVGHLCGMVGFELWV